MTLPIVVYTCTSETARLIMALKRNETIAWSLIPGTEVEVFTRDGLFVKTRSSSWLWNSVYLIALKEPCFFFFLLKPILVRVNLMLDSGYRGINRKKMT